MTECVLIFISVTYNHPIVSRCSWLRSSVFRSSGLFVFGNHCTLLLHYIFIFFILILVFRIDTFVIIFWVNDWNKQRKGRQLWNTNAKSHHRRRKKTRLSVASHIRNPSHSKWYHRGNEEFDLIAGRWREEYWIHHFSSFSQMLCKKKSLSSNMYIIPIWLTFLTLR